MSQRRAAQYLRMSTEKQAVSLENQAAGIARYAQERGYEVVRSYVDEGISGLTLKERPALQSLLGDVLAGRADFDAVLTFDVSRWGRFQDPDEAAHYEFVCRQAGVRIHYCAEPFDNDATMVGSLLKAMKRVMAAEYSRELSAKVWEGQRTHARRGRWMAGRPAYGLRRVMVRRNGERQTLRDGEHKALREDLVTVEPGPPEEVKEIRRVFELYVEDGLSLTRTAEIMNEEAAPGGRGWTLQRVYATVRNETFAGTLVFGKLKGLGVGGPMRAAPRDTWVRVTGAVEPVISREMFAAAEARRRPPFRGDDDELLRILAGVVETEGYVSHRLLMSRPDLPSSQAYVRRFGGLAAAYKLIGYTPRYPPRVRVSKTWLRRIDEALIDREARPAHRRPTYKRIWRRLLADGFPGSFDYLRAYAIRWSEARHPELPKWREVGDDELIRRLKGLLDRQGELSIRLIDAAEDLPSAAVYWKRFGGMERVYDLVGWRPPEGSPAALAAIAARRSRERARAAEARHAQRQPPA